MTDEWAPKTRDDWVGMFGEGYKKALSELRSEQEEADAKKAADETAQNNDKGGTSGDRGSPARKSFADRLLGK